MAIADFSETPQSRRSLRSVTNCCASRPSIRPRTRVPTSAQRFTVAGATRGGDVRESGTTGGWLYVEYSFYLLPPIDVAYTGVDYLYSESLTHRLRKTSAWSIVRAVPYLLASPFSLAKQAIKILSWNARESAQGYSFVTVNLLITALYAALGKARRGAIVITSSKGT